MLTAQRVVKIKLKDLEPITSIENHIQLIIFYKFYL